MNEILIISDDRHKRDLYVQFIIAEKTRESITDFSIYLSHSIPKAVEFSDRSRLVVLDSHTCRPSVVRGHRWSKIYVDIALPNRIFGYEIGEILGIAAAFAEIKCI